MADMKSGKQNLPFTVRPGDPARLGAGVTEKGIHFAFVNESDKDCGVLLYKTGKTEPAYRVPLGEEYRTGHVFAALLEGLQAGDCYYNFYIGEETVYDPYAKALSGTDVWGRLDTQEKQRRVRCALPGGSFDWEGDKPLRVPYHELIGYQLHVRGFTKHVTAQVEHRGYFEGIVEKIPYFLELGVNMLELLPAYEFNEVMLQRTGGQAREEIEPFMSKEAVQKPGINYWGFTRGSYFAPKSAYAAGDDPAASFKSMVKALHKNGISLVMQFYFPPEVEEGEILACVRYWVLEYHVDGFHLAGERIPVFALAKDPLLADTRLMFGGLDTGEIYSRSVLPAQKNLAEYNDGFLIDCRRYLKGDEGMLQPVAARFRRNPEGMAVINYMSNYNTFTMLDMVSYDRKHNEDNGEENRDGSDYNYSWNCGAEGKTKKKAILKLRKQQMKNALAFLMLSQGTPLLYAGDERCHTQFGNNNPYCQDNAVSWLNWRESAMGQEIFEFTRQLIALRRAHPILHKAEGLRLMDYISCGYPDLSYHGEQAWYPRYESYERCIAIMYCGKYAMRSRRQEDDFFLAAYNMHWMPHECALPTLPEGMVWQMCMDTSVKEGIGICAEGRELPLSQQDKLTVPGRTVMLLIGKKEVEMTEA